MNDPVNTKQCTNCKLQILHSNYTVHSLHCVKNIYLCDKCEQPVNYNKKTDHYQTNHVFVFCTNCNTKLEKYLLENHLENDCPYRKIKCQICDIEVAATDISEHENYCGARTEKCAECGEFVMLKYKSLHIDSNHTFIKLSDEPGPSPSWQNGRRTLHNFMPDLSLKTLTHAVDHKKKSSEFNRRSRNLDADEWPALNSFKALRISQEKENNPARSEASNSSEKKKPAIPQEDLMYAIEVSQELNSHKWSKDTNTKNEESLKNSFKLHAKNHLSGEKVIKKNMFDKNVKEENRRLEVNTNSNYSDRLYEEQEIVKLPCEFCGTLIISNELILHQSRCSLNMTEPYRRRSTRHEFRYFDESDEDICKKKISCGICNKVFKSSLLENHELHCKGNTTKPGKIHDKGNHSRSLRYTNVKPEPSIQNGAEPNSSKLNRLMTESEWLSELSKNTEGKKDLKKNLNYPETGGSNKIVKASRKSRRAPSPPRR